MWVTASKTNSHQSPSFSSVLLSVSSKPTFMCATHRCNSFAEGHKWNRRKVWLFAGAQQMKQSHRRRGWWVQIFAYSCERVWFTWLAPCDVLFSHHPHDYWLIEKETEAAYLILLITLFTPKFQPYVFTDVAFLVNGQRAGGRVHLGSCSHASSSPSLFLDTTVLRASVCLRS